MSDALCALNSLFIEIFKLKRIINTVKIELMHGILTKISQNYIRWGAPAQKTDK